ncbi:ataxin-10-like [Chenopodium quinoa]|uniref:Ataxin-10 domain-containing protein n=1 Tax=Chenopodium quinoa TaxID=63459 RepID=A0A803MQ26_CHEQI|nr:ataxin-10-like [Chenopodium quinoa]
MDAALSGEIYIPEDILQPLLKASNSSTLNEALQSLIGVSRTEDGRSDLASKRILPAVLQLIQSIPHLSAHHFLLLSLRLLRNLCAGDVENQNLFIECNGLGVVSSAINVVGFDIDDSGVAIIRTALQVVANVSLAGEKHQCAIWDQFFPELFLKIARIRKRETCDPLCMIIYTCSDGSIKLFPELCRTQGLAIMAEIIQTASEVGFGEDWLKIILSRICLEESHFSALFTSLNGGFDNLGNDESRGINFTTELAFLLRILSEILNERLKEIHVGPELALFVLGIFEKAVKAVDFYTRGESGLPTGISTIDVLGYSLTVLRDICAQGKPQVADTEEVPEDTVDSLVSRGLLDLLLSLLRELELPSSIRKSMKPGENQGLTSQPSKVCPYKGFRRDIVAVIANCSFGRKYVQVEVREKNGIILLLQQCVLDEDNPFLREWGIWCASNILQGNAENQQMVADLEMQGTVEVPELAKLGLRVDIDPNTKHAKLVNIS